MTSPAFKHFGALDSADVHVRVSVEGWELGIWQINFFRLGSIPSYFQHFENKNRK
jgi:hypothetical protein